MDIADSYDWAGILGKVVLAVVILIATWIVARLVRWIVAKLVARIGFLQKEGANGQEIGDSIGKIAALLVWLFGLIAVLQVFQLRDVLGPIQGMLDTIMGYLPNIIGAAFVFFIGYVIATIIKQLIEAVLGTVDFAALFGKAKGAASSVGADGTTPVEAGDAATATSTRETNARIVSVIANLVFAIILIVVAIAALQILGISSISAPATAMLEMILAAVPRIIAALVVLGIGFLIAKFVGDILEGTLRGVGTDDAVARLGVTTGRTSPSAVITLVVKIAILVFFAIMAAQLLGFPTITNLLNEILVLGGKVVIGGAIIAAGVFIANLLAKIVEGTASTIIRYATIVLFSAIGLQYMGLADSIITLAFGSLVVGGALAAALAFGLGGRDAAARSLAKLETKAETPGGGTAPPAPPAAPPAAPGV
ncbi:mechanosensitive ion channel [Isoptericola sp. BMS4]|uniref:mechanosensitive ion channel n=1 Tax=Isoptericola sp. BMS4 TaxID=2527875 RepID=UPI0014233120|nr:mechanosensitive ion channel [Isoptericola sp. BMS4]